MNLKSATTRTLLALGLFMALGLNAHASEKTKTSGPEIKVSDEEISKDSSSEEGLNRLGNFGKFHFFGYGDVHYNGKMGATGNEIDFHRLTLGFGYDFTDSLLMRMELDFEHAFKEPELEFAYLDFLIKDWANLRAGAIVVPMGYYNEHHEPPLYYSVERPQLYRVIIPSTWQGVGAGVFGKLGNGLEYQLYGLSSLNAVSLNDDGTLNDTFSGSEGFHDDHSIGEAPGRDFGGAARIQFTGVPGLRLGASTYLGNTGQGNGAIGGGFLTMVEADAKYSFEGIDLEGIVAYSRLSDAGNINNVIVGVDPTFTDFVASSMLGWYVEAAYHVLHHIAPNSKHDLVVFTRFEDFDTQLTMPTGFAKDQANNRRTITTGVSYMPIPNVAIKADYMANWNAANGDVDQFNLGVAFYY